MVLMSAFWVTEAVPLPVTALIPIFAFPLLDILNTADLSKNYFKDTNMMFLGNFTNTNYYIKTTLLIL